MPVTRQLSLFGVEASDPTPADLAGLLAGPGEVSRLGGTARVSVPVAAAWRVHAIAAELAARNLAGSWQPAPPAPPARAAHPAQPAETQPEEPQPETPHPAAPAAGFVVRTAYTALLAPLAAAWWDAERAVKRPPPGWHLAGPALRLWVAAAGEPSPDGYLLRLGVADAAGRAAVGAALQAIGLAAALVTGPAGAASYRITSRRRMGRLAELVGDPPPVAPPHAWPVPAQARQAP